MPEEDDFGFKAGLRPERRGENVKQQAGKRQHPD
jgi:hypothetical protein